MHENRSQRSTLNLGLFTEDDVRSVYLVQEFSAGSLQPDVARRTLEARYAEILEVTSTFNRRSVSFQLSKQASVHSWLKYREGFSADLVNILLDRFKVEPSATVLDPFLGSGTTAFVSQLRGINAVGFDLLPTSKLAINAKSRVYQYDDNELENLLSDLRNLSIPVDYPGIVNSVPITDGAYPIETSRDLAFLKNWMGKNGYSEIANDLLHLCLVNSLERLSYTNKDGQYLRWDYRSQKVVNSNKRRSLLGQGPVKTLLDKGVLPRAIDIAVQEFEGMLMDIKILQSKKPATGSSTINFIEKSVLLGLPSLEANSIDAVITSPPYCNRYDYTRTYALELAFLGLNNDDIKSLRQSLLSATVENRSKLSLLSEEYERLGRGSDFVRVTNVIDNCEALQETIQALKHRMSTGDINNNGVVRMVEGYFTELGFVFAELFRVCKPGAHVAFVNDNVRYGGEIIPIDFLSTRIAEQLGFEPVSVYCLKQQKGNSSQQMKRFGRAPLRKSITIWKKPLL